MTGVLATDLSRIVNIMTDFSAGSGNGVLPVSCTRLARDGLSRLILGPALVAALTLIPVRYAHADSLFQSMASAYVTNPSLNAARAGQRATDELVPRALSGWRPSVTVQGNVQAEWGSTNSAYVEGARMITQILMLLLI